MECPIYSLHVVNVIVYLYAIGALSKLDLQQMDDSKTLIRSAQLSFWLNSLAKYA